MKTRRLIAFLLVLCMAFVIVGCNKVVVEKGTEKTTDTQISMSYERFNGSKEYSITVDKETTITTTVLSKGGNLYLKVKQAGKQAIVNENITGKILYPITLPSAGTYKITMKGDNHVGSFNLDWSGK